MQQDLKAFRLIKHDEISEFIHGGEFSLQPDQDILIFGFDTSGRKVQIGSQDRLLYLQDRQAIPLQLIRIDIYLYFPFPASDKIHLSHSFHLREEGLDLFVQEVIEEIGRASCREGVEGK